MFVSATTLGVFIPTFFFVSITPGMCMTLSMTLGMSVGVKRAMWMMYGELIGVGLVAIAAVSGAATVMLLYPMAFTVMKVLGGIYLLYLGVQLWRSKGKMAVSSENTSSVGKSRYELALQGFMTATTNPKGWAFFIALLPPFISASSHVVPQVMSLVSIILFLEFTCLLLYATGGRYLSQFLHKSGNVRFINRIAGTLMIGVGIWLAAA
ncbi:LysE family translocator [Vibrio marisflavi]|uniref:Homoserine/homoserine lactone efflux protein n=1 Tax=Vibrio marisflavi CECT 7928 TaxID=634439 RepID=A0ABN8E7M0_9VIBR|nr:LysE family translocator [Vibrio marisflavi]CAH0540715.1 Homoserine/homoserine lactone efflux protein [Vibrio marisflavi CECT 7928]